MLKPLLALTALCACSLPAFAAAFGGFLDAANCSIIGGWAWDSSLPNTPISVDIYERQHSDCDRTGGRLPAGSPTRGNR
jgi:hypothetical protein